MSEVLLVRFYHPEVGIRLGVQRGDVVHDVTAEPASVAEFLHRSAGRVDAAVSDLLAAADQSIQTFPTTSFDQPPSMEAVHRLAPVDVQEVWAAGVTYERSRTARQEEAVDGGDIYARVYAAERPELFFKARGDRVIGPLGEVGIRRDATWNVPEPELALVMNPAMEVVGLTIGNDMSSRDIEGANPLYLPQAKVYTASCALGPGILLGSVQDWPDTTIRMAITRGGATVFTADIHTSRIHRTIGELLQYLGRSSSYPDGVVLLTGTGIVPPGDFTLVAGDVVTITIDGIGTLTNTVKVV